MSVSEPDVQQALEALPALSLLVDDVRQLVAASFEPVAYPFGAVIVREGEPADAFYILTSGTARVVKHGDGGGDVPLNVLHGGDSFGEAGLLEGGTRTVTVRASGPVEALRLDGTVFSALTRTHPEVRSTFEASRTSGRCGTSSASTRASRTCPARRSLSWRRASSGSRSRPAPSSSTRATRPGRCT